MMPQVVYTKYIGIWLLRFWQLPTPIMHPPPPPPPQFEKYKTYAIYIIATFSMTICTIVYDCVYVYVCVLVSICT